MIVIIADPLDAHARVVHRRLVEKGARAAIIALGELPVRARLSTWIDANATRARIRRDRDPETIELAEVETVWLRRRGFWNCDPDLEPEDAEFARQETLSLVAGLAQAMSDRFWVNPPTAALAQDAGHGKIAQLDVARRLGVAVPRTLATNDPEAAREFIASCASGAVVKPFNSPTRVREEGGRKKVGGVFTNALDERALKKLDAVALAPCIFQELVPKRVELRVVVIGDRVLACEIHSQAHEGSSIDFRRRYALGETVYRPHAMPAEVERALVRLHRELGLVFGSADVVLTPDGRYVFLETNQQGQFLWLEEMTGMPLLENFCELLIQRTPSFACAAEPHAPGPFAELPPLDPRDAALADGESDALSRK